MIHRHNHRHTPLDDAGLLGGNPRQRIAEPRLMIELNIRDHTRQRRRQYSSHRAARPIPSPQITNSHFCSAKYFNAITVTTSKNVGCSCTGNCASQSFISPTNRTISASPINCPIHLHPLPKRRQMRRRKQSHLQPRRAVNALQHRARRTLAVRSRHMDKPQSLLRIPLQLRQVSTSAPPPASSRTTGDRHKNFIASG